YLANTKLPITRHMHFFLRYDRTHLVDNSSQPVEFRFRCILLRLRDDPTCSEIATALQIGARQFQLRFRRVQLRLLRRGIESNQDVALFRFAAVLKLDLANSSA